MKTPLEKAYPCMALQLHYKYGILADIVKYYTSVICLCHFYLFINIFFFPSEKNSCNLLFDPQKISSLMH